MFRLKKKKTFLSILSLFSMLHQYMNVVRTFFQCCSNNVSFYKAIYESFQQFQNEKLKNKEKKC